jgi:hypothetical protein
MEKMHSNLVSKKGQKRQQASIKPSSSVDQIPRDSEIPDEESDEDEDFQVPDQEVWGI